MRGTQLFFFFEHGASGSLILSLPPGPSRVFQVNIYPVGWLIVIGVQRVRRTAVQRSIIIRAIELVAAYPYIHPPTPTILLQLLAWGCLTLVGLSCRTAPSGAGRGHQHRRLTMSFPDEHPTQVPDPTQAVSLITAGFSRSYDRHYLGHPRNS